MTQSKTSSRPAEVSEPAQTAGNAPERITDAELSHMERHWHSMVDDSYFPSDPKLLSLIEEVKASRVAASSQEAAPPKFRPLPDIRRALAESIEQILWNRREPDSRTETWEKRVGLIESAFSAYETAMRAEPAPSPATKETPPERERSAMRSEVRCANCGKTEWTDSGKVMFIPREGADFGGKWIHGADCGDDEVPVDELLQLQKQADWERALTEYRQLREEIGRLEETGECGCDVNEFHTCSLCAETALLDQRARSLMNLWGDTWAMRLTAAITDTPGVKSSSQGPAREETPPWNVCLKAIADFVWSWRIVEDGEDGSPPLGEASKTHNNALAIAVGEILDPQDNAPLIKALTIFKDAGAKCVVVAPASSQ